MELTIAEQLLLIALDDETGKDTTYQGIDAGLAGAILLELAKAEAIRDDDGKVVADGPAPADPPLAQAHEAIAHDEKRRDAKAWVSRLQRVLKPIKGEVAERLVHHGVLTEERHKTLGLFTTTRFPEADAAPERALRERLRATLLGQRKAEPDDALLVALLNAYDLPKKLVDNDDRKQARATAKAIADEGIAGAAVAKTLRDIESAVMLTVVTAATAGAAGAGS